MTRTNDLASIALTNSILHGLAIPLIYSRFDIVWPDANRQTDARTGVDALTYGLATLAMRQDIFMRPSPADESLPESGCQSHACNACGHANLVNPRDSVLETKRRKGNYYSEFVKKLSIGNGPPDMINDYIITTESGKLLGTNVALALARMPNLESFVWDMPTGIVRDVWASLASLGDLHPCKLEKVSVRFHDNKRACEESGPVRSPHSTQAPANSRTGPITVGSTSMAIEPESASLTDVAGLIPVFAYTNYHVETPSFSVLPPLRSISAVDIDEVVNLSDLSSLIAKSVDKLRVLRVGMAPNLRSSRLPPTSRALQYLLGCCGGDGTLSLLFSSLPHCRPTAILSLHGQDGWSYEPFIEQSNNITKGPPQAISVNDMSTYSSNHPLGCPRFKDSDFPAQVPTLDQQITNTASVIDKLSIDPELQSVKISEADDQASNTNSNDIANAMQPSLQLFSQDDRDQEASPPPYRVRPFASTTAVVKRLKLECLELERHLLQPDVLKMAIDWTVLTSLTLLKCVDSSILWQIIARDFAPSKQSSLPTSPSSSQQSISDGPGIGPETPRLRRTTTSWRSSNQPEYRYRLSLKRLHTDTVSPHLISFLTRTLAPNSMEWLFLQDCSQYKSTVSISQIYKGPLRRHRGSLTKVLIDSAHGTKSSARISSARKWLLSRDILSSLLSQNRGVKLHELCISVSYKDWHWFLQQLPKMQCLRSLYVPIVADHVWGSSFSIRDVAMGILNVINLRRECELSYLAVMNKCYEIVESTSRPKRHPWGSDDAFHYDSDVDSSSEEATPHVSDSEDMTDDEDNQGAGAGNSHSAADHLNRIEDGDETSSDDNSGMPAPKALPKLKMREILFYDEKVSVFKARHAKL